MNRKKISTNIKKCTIFMKVFKIILHASSCDQLSLHAEYHPGIFLLNNKIDMSNKLHKL